MRIKNITALSVALAAAALAGCGGGGGGSSSLPIVRPTNVPTPLSTPTPTPVPQATQPPPNPYISPVPAIYVAGGGPKDSSGQYWIRVYDSPTSTSPSRTIMRGTRQTWQMAFDQYGYLYVSGEDQPTYTTAVTGTVDVFAPGGSSPVRTLQTGTHLVCGLAIDKAGTVYVATGCDGGVVDPAEILEFAYGSTAPTKTVTGGMRGPSGLALDKNGNLFIADQQAGVVQELPAGGSAVQILRLHNGYSPVGIAIDPKGDLTIGDDNGIDTYTASDVAASASEIVNPMSEFSVPPPPTQPNAIASATEFISYGADGTLYAANPYTFLNSVCNGVFYCQGPGFVAIFPPSSQTPSYWDNQYYAADVVAWPSA